MSRIIFKKIFVASFFLVVTFKSTAQKLPEKQIDGVSLPVNINIDGRAEEWSDKFHAYSKSTSIYYTVANDKNLFYVVIYCTENTIIKKIMTGGITLSFNAFGVKKYSEDTKAITFPVLDNKSIAEISATLSSYVSMKSDHSKQSDSLFYNLNSILTANSKILRIKNLKNIANMDLSVNNNLDLKAKAGFDMKGYLTCEFLIPLETIGINRFTQKQLAYNIKLNGVPENSNSLITSEQIGQKTVYTTPHGFLSSSKPNALFDLIYPTDFWSTYTLY